MTDATVETTDVLAPVPLKANRRSLVRRLFGRKKNHAHGDEATEPRGSNKTARGAKKQVVKKKKSQEQGEEREPESATKPSPPTAESVKEETTPEPEPEETMAVSESPKASVDAPVDPPAEQVVPETVDSDSSHAEEDNTMPTTENAQQEAETMDVKAEQLTEVEKQEGETPASPTAESQEASEVEAVVQRGDDASRDPPTTKATAGLFCGCI